MWAYSRTSGRRWSRHDWHYHDISGIIIRIIVVSSNPWRSCLGPDPRHQEPRTKTGMMMVCRNRGREWQLFGRSPQQYHLSTTVGPVITPKGSLSLCKSAQLSAQRKHQETKRPKQWNSGTVEHGQNRQSGCLKTGSRWAGRTHGLLPRKIDPVRLSEACKIHAHLCP